MKYIFGLFLTITLWMGNYCYAQANQPTQIKLYAMNCGKIAFTDFAAFSDTGDYDKKSVELVDPCFLVVHPKGTLLWDTGLPDSYIKKPVKQDIYHFTKATSLQDSLKLIGLKLKDINYVSISHSHFDHAGNLDQLPNATWILQKSELSYGKTKPNPYVMDVTSFKNWKTVNKNIITSDYDVFGDGTVQILNTPGHTPGHQALKIILPQAGVIILSGDEFHQRTSFDPLRIPVFNSSRAETMASADRINKLLKNTNGRLIVQHDKGDFETLPRFPSYLE